MESQLVHSVLEYSPIERHGDRGYQESHLSFLLRNGYKGHRDSLEKQFRLAYDVLFRNWSCLLARVKQDGSMVIVQRPAASFCEAQGPWPKDVLDFEDCPSGTTIASKHSETGPERWAAGEGGLPVISFKVEFAEDGFIVNSRFYKRFLGENSVRAIDLFFSLVHEALASNDLTALSTDNEDIVNLVEQASKHDLTSLLNAAGPFPLQNYPGWSGVTEGFKKSPLFLGFPANTASSQSLSQSPLESRVYKFREDWLNPRARCMKISILMAKNGGDDDMIDNLAIKSVLWVLIAQAQHADAKATDPNTKSIDPTINLTANLYSEVCGSKRFGNLSRCTNGLQNMSVNARFSADAKDMLAQAEDGQIPDAAFISAYRALVRGKNSITSEDVRNLISLMEQTPPSETASSACGSDGVLIEDYGADGGCWRDFGKLGKLAGTALPTKGNRASKVCLLPNAWFQTSDGDPTAEAGVDKDKPNCHLCQVVLPTGQLKEFDRLVNLQKGMVLHEEKVGHGV